MWLLHLWSLTWGRCELDWKETATHRVVCKSEQSLVPVRTTFSGSQVGKLRSTEKTSQSAKLEGVYEQQNPNGRTCEVKLPSFGVPNELRFQSQELKFNHRSIDTQQPATPTWTCLHSDVTSNLPGLCHQLHCRPLHHLFEFSVVSHTDFRFDSHSATTNNQPCPRSRPLIQLPPVFGVQHWSCYCCCCYHCHYSTTIHAICHFCVVHHDHKTIKTLHK